MIITQQVEDAVDDQPGHFMTEAVATFPGLSLRRRDRNDDVPQKKGRGSVPILFHPDRFRMRERKCQHVGGLIFAAVNPVERLDPAVA